MSVSLTGSEFRMEKRSDAIATQGALLVGCRTVLLTPAQNSYARPDAFPEGQIAIVVPLKGSAKTGYSDAS